MIFKELSKDEYGKLLGIFMCNTEVHPNSELVKSGRFLKPHADNYKNVNQGNIAIGYGFDLKVNDIAQITKMYRGVFGDKWQLTQEETLVLKDYKNGKITTSAALSKFGSIQNLSLDLKTRDNAYKLYSLTLSTYENKVNSSIPKSYERLALVSRAYNHYGSALMKAVSQRDRFLIWFHLRYTINTQRGKELNGLTKRRLWESDIFDLIYKDDFEAVINIFSSLNIFKFNEERMIKYILAYEKRNFTEENISSFKKDATSRNLTSHFSFKYNKIKDTVAPFLNKLHSLIKEVTSTVFDFKNIYVVNLNSDGTNNISKINKALKILLICPYHSAQIIAPYQPKNTKLTIILADKTYLDCINLNPQGSKDESKLMLTNYKFNPYEANSKEEDIKFVDSATSGDVTLYKDSNNKFISQDKKYSYDGSKVTLNFFNNLNFNLLNFAKENGFSLRSDKSSAMFDVRLKLADKEESKPTTNNGNCNLIVKNLIITDENLNSSDIKEIYLHNCEDKRVYRSCSLEKNDNEEADKNSYTAKFNINLILDKDQSVFKRTTKFILAYRDLSKDYSTSDIHSMSDNSVISLEAKKKAEGSITYDLKTSLIEVANNITGVVVDVQNIDQTTIQDTINLKAIYKPNKGDDNYKEVNWSYKIIKQGEYNKEVKANFVANDIKLEGEKFKGKEISFTPQTDIKDQKLLDKLKEGDSTLVFFAYLKAPRYTTRYGKTHGRVDIKYEKSLFLEFDGEFLSIHITYNELKQVHSFKAVSGAPIKGGSNYYFEYSKKRQLLANEGPVPEGTYYITPLSSNKDDAIQYWEKLDNVQHFKASIAMGSWPGGKKSWGSVRIPILPKSITLLDDSKEIKRNNFFIHGGEKAGSRGCIDLCENDIRFFEVLLSYIELIKSKDKIPLIIKYKQKNIKCDSDLKLKFCTEETDYDQDF